ncbi:hypothetical protein [Candidatus Accumulibacter sp. ACC012]|uniref:hypothetical protein n=1 Tax=Candidatus Accumulibacter sp. ACC012 TaxID=2823332 RepID=UPI0025C01D40|nr:hypothetical protein [Candidatus Accumulibacter sp. ACC012]
MHFGDGQGLDDEGAHGFTELRHRGPLSGAKVDQKRKGLAQRGQGGLGLFVCVARKMDAINSGYRMAFAQLLVC